MHTPIKQCLCCGNETLYTIIDLGHQPPANSFHTVKETLPEYELKLMGCANCWHTQLSVAVDPAELFRHYLYVSGTSETLQRYFREFAERQGGQPGTVLDIACNDGSQLNAFRALGWQTVGVDPAENLTPIAAKSGHEVYTGFWDMAMAIAMDTTYDLIIAQNVFAHTANPGAFLDACYEVMNRESRLLIQTSQAHMFERGEFDTIYHEHISFFCVNSMKAIADRHGFSVTDVQITDIHGGSYVFELKVGPGQPCRREPNELYKHHREFYEEFAVHARTVLKNLKDTVNLFKTQDYTVIGYGAAAKGMTLLNAGEIGLDFIVDDNKLKQGLLTPGMNTPVHSPDHLLYYDRPVVFVPLAWNFFSEIKTKIKQLRPEYPDQFVLYFPEIQIQR